MPIRVGGGPGAVDANKNPMQDIRFAQITQLYSFFPNIVMTDKNQAGDSHRIPLLLTRAAQPIFVLVSVPFAYP